MTGYCDRSARFGLVLLLICLPARSGAAEDLEGIIRGGRIVDGTGAPWYVGDIGVADGRIARIGRLGESEATWEIDATGLVVAPGFIDMMGQTASPMLEDPAAALNLLAQGITTINAGEGVSAAPLSGNEGASQGWSTMAEYFQILDLAGLPINVAQTVGHTQVRRLVLGESDRAPEASELHQMRSLVREAMEAGAIGVSTALIYPPAVYADTGEIASLASVAGEFGGRYFTHLRNEGDRLLEAIDEALEIGRQAGTPVHIFHLKAAGRQNWEKIEASVERIFRARARGEEVAADIYPYVHNGLRISAMVHPRHFAEGREAFAKRLADAGFRDLIRSEMESGEGEWENWFRHIGGDWSRLIVGRIESLRLQSHAGASLAEIAEAVEADPWEVFFELLRTEAFVLPESMSEHNKIRLMREQFISFCTDVGPSGGSAGSSHPRGAGAFARLLSRYVRDGEAISLERAVAQGCAAAANEIFAFDRGRIAPGLAADLIVFDYAAIAERATFADPRRTAEGMKHVLVNGQRVFQEGKLTGRRPGYVLRGPGYAPDAAPGAISTGRAVPELAELDGVMRDFLRRHRIPGAALAVTDAGRLVYARGFGYADLARREPVRPGSLFRIASISKPVTAAAVLGLVEDGKLDLDDRIFDILDHYRPPRDGAAVDARLAEITIRHLLRHEGGWDRDRSFDPMFRSVSFAERVGVPPPAGQDEIIRNMLAQPLDFDPGARQAYSNFGFCLLGRAIASAAEVSYETFVKTRILDLAGARTMTLGRTRAEDRMPGEVRYYAPRRDTSVFPDDLGRQVPAAYGAWYLEAMDSHGGWLASVLDLARFALAVDPRREDGPLAPATLERMFAPEEPDGGDAGADRGSSRFVLGWLREPSEAGPGYSHSGSLAGTSTLLVKRPDGRNWILLFNARRSPGIRFLPSALRPRIEETLDKVGDWPDHDLFHSFPGHSPVPREPAGRRP